MLEWLPLSFVGYAYITLMLLAVPCREYCDLNCVAEYFGVVFLQKLTHTHMHTYGKTLLLRLTYQESYFLAKLDWMAAEKPKVENPSWIEEHFGIFSRASLEQETKEAS